MRALVIDPGMETGVVYAEADDRELCILEKLQVTGGLQGFIEYMRDASFHYDALVCEKFRIGPKVYRQNELEPLRIEGAVYYLSDTRVTWQYNNAMLIGGASGTAAKNKRAADAVLKELGLWTTGSQIGAKDANDVNSAMKHLVHYLNMNDNKYIVKELERINGV